MKIDFDTHKFKPMVTLTESELKTAFTSETEFIKLLHEITRKCYGEYIANLCFPLERSNE